MCVKNEMNEDENITGCILSRWLGIYDHSHFYNTDTNNIVGLHKF